MVSDVFLLRKILQRMKVIETEVRNTNKKLDELEKKFR